MRAKKTKAKTTKAAKAKPAARKKSAKKSAAKKPVRKAKAKKAGKRRAAKPNRSTLATVLEYLNQAGKNLSEEAANALNQVKEQLHKQFG